MYCKKEDCINKNIKCENCRLNYPKPDHSYYQTYKPACPQGYTDCVYDPAYIKYHTPRWYEELYGDLSPEEVAEKNCNVEEEYCYDDVDR